MTDQKMQWFSHFICIFKTGYILCFYQKHMNYWVPCKYSLVSGWSWSRRGTGTRVTLRKQGHKRCPERDKVHSQGDEGNILSERPLAPCMEAKLKAACSVWIAFSSAFMYSARWKP